MATPTSLLHLYSNVCRAVVYRCEDKDTVSQITPETIAQRINNRNLGPLQVYTAESQKLDEGCLSIYPNLNGPSTHITRDHR